MLFRTKINTVRKMTGNDASKFLTNDGKLKGLFGCQRNATVNLGNELKGEAASFAFIPCACIDEPCTGGAIESDWRLIA